MSAVLFNLHDVILLLSFYQCLLLAVLFACMTKATRLSRVFIVGFFLFNAVTPLDTLILFGASFRDFAIHNLPNWFYVFEFGYWFQGPFLLWYFKSKLYRDFQFNWANISYLMPFVIYLLHQVTVYHTSSTELKVGMLEGYNLGDEPALILFVVMGREILRLYFGVMCMFELRKYLEALRNKGNAYDHNSVTWLTVLGSGFVAFWSVSSLIVVGVVFNVTQGMTLPVDSIGLVSNYLFAFFLGGVFIMLSQGYFASSNIEKIAEKNVQEPRRKPPVNEALLAKLEDVMLDEQPYLDPRLTLERLAQKVDVNARTLSNLINAGFSCNFFAYVNRYRIQEAKKKLTEANKNGATVLNIMLEVGFQNKATFNSLFKKMEGMTPSKYRKQALTDGAEAVNL
ncbi:MAG: AraC family transcriptional regulator [Alteromonadaceae bacterium]|nr:MAG: AraC family transcriptional regulator [Alteromonadaceae bacterium]